MTWTKFINLFHPLSGGCICNLILISKVLSERKSFENVDNGRGTDDGGYHPIRSPRVPASEELKTQPCYHIRSVAETKADMLPPVKVYPYLNISNIPSNPILNFPSFTPSGLFNVNIR